MSQVWHEDDYFWETFGPVMFSADRWAGTPKEIDDIIRLAGVMAGTHILDTCCGPGRHALEWSRRGYQVTAIDRTSAYLTEARSKATAEGLNVEFVQADMREFIRPNTFDFAHNLYTSFSYFEDPADDAKLLENIFHSLKAGGRLVIEMAGKEVIARIFQPRTWHPVGNDAFMLEERTLLDGWSRIRSCWRLIQGGKVAEYTYEHRLYSGKDLADLLRQVGFSNIQLFGHLEGDPYDHNARRLVALAQKTI
jgi:SAM-dependent methyltransferase